MENLVQDGQAFSRTAQSLSNVEKEYYTVLWQSACVQGDILRGKAAFDFLSKSQLPREILKRIWDIADWQKRGLAWEEFVVTLKLISAAQKKQLVSLERVLETSGPTSRDLPTFDGIAAPPDGEAPEAPQKRDVFAEFEALAGIQVGATGAAPDVLPEVSHPPAEPLQNLVEEPVNDIGGTTSFVTQVPDSVASQVTSNEGSKWDAFDEPVWRQAPTSAASAASAASADPAPAPAPAHESQWQAFGEAAVGEPETSQKWGAFGDAHMPETSKSPEAEKDQKWAAFGNEAEPAAAQVEWDAFGNQPAPKDSWSAFGSEVQVQISKPEEEADWAAFESASGPTATAPTTASTTAPTGDLWSKMSAFDDLLKEDDALGGSAGAVELGQALTSSVVDPETERPTETAEPNVPIASEGDDDSEFGDFAAGPSSSPEAEADREPISGQGNMDFMDFSPPVSTFPTSFPSTAPVGSADIVNNLTAEVAGEAGPEPASASFAAFDADFGDFGSAEAPATQQQNEEPTGLLDFEGDFGDFGDGKASDVAMPAVPASSTSGLADVWAAFPEPGPASTELSHPAEPAQSVAFESWNTFEGGSGAPQGGGEDWASFGTFDFPAQPASGGAPDPEKADIKPSLSPKVIDEAPKQGNTPEPFTEDERDGGSEAVEARALARSLCSLGRFEEALQCQANGDVLRRLHAAEEKKKEAVAQDDFEGAIKIRSEIKEISRSLASEEVLEVWRNLARGDRDASLQMAAEQLRQRCQWMDGFSSAALGVAVGNFRRACPENRANCLPVLPSLVRQQRRARQMYRAIEAISSQNVLLFLQVIFVCIKTLCELLVESSVQISEFADPDWSDEERQCVHESDELQSLLRGLSSLRRLLWRLGLAAELFMPEGEGPVDGSDAEALQELQASIASSLAKAKASWAKLESDIISLRLKIEPWQEGSTFEAGGCTNGSVPEQQRTAPLCRLCLLPAVPLGMEAEIEERDPGAVSAPWRGGHWHVQCANFWLRHASCSKAFKDLKVEDPFEEYHTNSGLVI